MIELSKPEKSEYWSIVNPSGDIVSSGRIEPHLVLATANPTIIHNQNENAYLSELNTHGTVSDPLPPMGTELVAGVVYAWNGQNVIVRQDHTRTEHDPDTVPALFLVYRESYDGMEWIANENVLKGDERTHDSINYECIQSHTTVVGQTPDLVPALWVVIPDETGEWQAGVAYALDDEVTYLELSYKCLQPHTAQVGWDPISAPALWSPL